MAEVDHRIPFYLELLFVFYSDSRKYQSFNQWTRSFEYSLRTSRFFFDWCFVGRCSLIVDERWITKNSTWTAAKCSNTQSLSRCSGNSSKSRKRTWFRFVHSSQFWFCVHLLNISAILETRTLANERDSLRERLRVTQTSSPMSFTFPLSLFRSLQIPDSMNVLDMNNVSKI